jgi:hypothetical protein
MTDSPPTPPAELAAEVIADAVEQARAYGVERLDLAPVVDRYVRRHRAVWDRVLAHDPHQSDDVDAWGLTPPPAPRPSILTVAQVAGLAVTMTGGRVSVSGATRFLVLPEEAE